jgi:DedD protein
VDVQAKDRLTGAVILVVLLVLVVPELLSGPERKVASVAIKAGDEPPLRSYTVELGDEAARAKHGVDSESAPATPPPVTATTTAAGPPPPPVVATPTAAVPLPVAAQPSQREPAKASAAPASPVPVAAPSSPAGWTVQLGSFASRTNAERLVHDLKLKGYAAFFTESSGGGRKLYRVRVGPAGNHAAAETLAAQLRSAGHPGSLTQRP